MNAAEPHVLTFDERLAAVTGAIDLHHAYLERYLTGLTRNHADAEDLLSGLWVHVLHKFKDEHIGSLPILRRKAYQLFIDYYRKKIRAREDLYDALPDLGSWHLGKEAYGAEEEIMFREKFWAEFPANLPESHREILWLSARYGFTIKEISERLRLAPSSVGDWLQSARKELANYINRQ